MTAKEFFGYFSIIPSVDLFKRENIIIVRNLGSNMFCLHQLCELEQISLIYSAFVSSSAKLENLDKHLSKFFSSKIV